MRWLKYYRQSLKDGSSAKVMKQARLAVWIFTALWSIGLICLLQADFAGGTFTSIIMAYAGLLVAALLIYFLVQLLFLPTRR